MQRARFLERERKLAAEKSIKYKGTASIRLDVLHFPLEKDNSDIEREEDESNIKRLKNLFREEGGCDRLDLRNHVVAVIDQDQLDDAIRASGTSASSLLLEARDSYPELEFPPGYRLRCLSGQDRVRAAAKVLPPGDKRWTVDLFLSDLDPELETTLTEEYSSEKAPDDGTFYCKIRQYQGYQGESNSYFERRWLALLSAESEHKRECFDQLFRHPDFRAAFDSLLFDIPGLGGGMRFSTMHKMIGAKCDEQNLCYLGHIYDVYSRIFRKDKQKMRKVTRADVKALELTAPGACRADAAALYGQVRSGRIFGAFDEQEREAIWKRVLLVSRDCLIPSLFSFFEDLNYLKVLADCMKRLIKIPPRKTVSSTLEQDEIFTDVNQTAGKCLIQESESMFRFRAGRDGDRFNLGQRQLWIYTMRYHPQLPPESKKKNLVANPAHKDVDEAVLCEFAALAYRLGFESEQIRSLMGRSADREIARNALLKARKPDRFRYTEAALEENVEKIVRLFSTAQPATAEQARAALEVDTSDTLPRRCGVPHTQDQNRDRLSLFLDKLHNGDEEVYDEMSSFFIRRSVYFAYFGRPTGATTSGSTRAQPLDLSTQQEQLAREQQAAQGQAALAERDRIAREQAAQEERDRIVREQAAQAERDRIAREKAAQAEKDRIAREQAEQAEQDRIAREQAEQAERDRIAQEQAAQEERDRIAREQAAQAERDRIAWEQAAQEQAAQSERDRIALEQAAQAQQDRITQELQEQQKQQEQAALLVNQWMEKGKQKKSNANLVQTGSIQKARIPRGLAASASVRRKERRMTQINLEGLVSQEQQEQLANAEQGRHSPAQTQEIPIADEQNRIAREQAERDQLAQEQATQAEQDRIAREQAERDQIAQEQAAQAERDRIAREQAAQAERDRIAQEQAAQAEQDRIAREQAEQVERDRIAREQAAQEERDRIAQEQAAQAERDRIAQEQAAQAEQDRIAQEQAAQAEQDRIAREQAEQAERDRIAQEQAAQAERDRIAQAERDRIAHEQAARAEQDRIAREQAALAARAEQDRIAQEKAVQAEQDRIAREKAEQVERDRIAHEQAARAERDRIAWEQASQEQAAQAERDRIAQEQVAHAQAEQDRIARAQATEQPENNDLYNISDRELERRRNRREEQGTQEQAAQEEQAQISRKQAGEEEEERVTGERLAKQWKEKGKTGSTAVKNKIGAPRGLAASALARRKERPVTQINLEGLDSQERQEQQEQQEQLPNAGQQDRFTMSRNLANQWKERREQRGSEEKGNTYRVLKGLGTRAREQRERRAQEEKERLEREELQRKETERVEERLTGENIAKLWKEQQGKPNEMLRFKGYEGARNKVRVPRGLAASAKRHQRPVTQIVLEPQVESRGRQTAEDLEEVGRRNHIPPLGLDSSATDNSNSTSTSSTIQEQTPHPGNQNQTVEPRATGPSTERLSDPSKVRIELKVLDHGVWQTVPLLVDPSEPWEVTRVVTKYMRKGQFYPFNTKLDKLTLQTCFKAVIADGTNTILLAAEADIDKLRRPLTAYPPASEPNLDGSLEDSRETSHENPARRPRRDI